MALVDQVDRLVTAGVAEAAGISAHQFRAQAAELPDVPDGILAVHPALVPASRLAPLLRHAGRAGFVVEDMTDVDAFAPIDTVTVPDLPVYVVYSPVRGDEMRNWSPDEALPAIHAAGRTREWIRGPRRSGSVGGPAGTARSAATHRRSDGAGRPIGTPGWGTPPPVIGPPEACRERRPDDPQARRVLTRPLSPGLLAPRAV